MTGVSSSVLVLVFLNDCPSSLRRIGEISGAIYKNVEEQISTNGLDSEDAFGLIAHSYHYSHNPNEAGFELAKTYVNRALELAPNLVFGLCRISFIYLDGYRFLFGGVAHSKKYLSKAMTSLIRAMELSPSSSMVNLLHSDMLFVSGKFEEAIKAGEFAIEQNPENHQIAAIHGFRCAAYGDWDAGLKYVRGLLVMPFLLAIICRIDF